MFKTKDGMTVLSGADFKKISQAHISQMDAIEKSIFGQNRCSFNNCEKLGIKRWEEFGDNLVCEFHYSVMDKHRGDD